SFRSTTDPYCCVPVILAGHRDGTVDTMSQMRPHRLLPKRHPPKQQHERNTGNDHPSHGPNGHPVAARRKLPNRSTAHEVRRSFDGHPNDDEEPSEKSITPELLEGCIHQTCDHENRAPNRPGDGESDHHWQELCDLLEFVPLRTAVFPLLVAF